MCTICVDLNTQNCLDSVYDLKVVKPEATDTICCLQANQIASRMYLRTAKTYMPQNRSIKPQFVLTSRRCYFRVVFDAVSGVFRRSFHSRNKKSVQKYN